ncbi:C2 domain protein [Trichuris suis]|nr:C2 domain protein [Trichuris suis]
MEPEKDANAMFKNVKRDVRTSSWSECGPGRPMADLLIPHERLLATTSSGSSPSSNSSFDMKQLAVDTSRLKPAVSCDSLLSLSSMADLSGGESECGMLEVRLAYSRPTNMLSIHLLQLHDARPVPAGNEMWFLLFLLPHQKPLFKTKASNAEHFQTNIEEEFEQCILEKDLRRVALLCQMYTRSLSDDKATAQLVGQSRIRLRDLRITKSCTNWLVLSPASKNVDGIDEGKQQVGDVLFSLSYSPAAQRLTVVIMKVKNVKMTDSGYSKGILIRVYLVYGPKVLRRKTSIQQAEEGCVRFNESMIFSLSQIHLNRVYLRVSVREAHSLTEFTTIGHVTVGARCSGKEFGHWQRMMDNPTAPLTMWHKLLAKPPQ